MNPPSKTKTAFDKPVPFAERPAVAAVIVFSPIATAIVVVVIYILLTKGV